MKRSNLVLLFILSVDRIHPRPEEKAVAGGSDNLFTFDRHLQNYCISRNLTRVLSRPAVYMAIVTTIKPTTKAMPITTPIKSRNSQHY